MTREEYWKSKQEQKVKRKPRHEPLEVNQSLNAFITFKVGKEAFDNLLSAATPVFLRWIARNTLLATQADDIRSRYLGGIDCERVVHGELSDVNGGESDLISSSAAATQPSACGGLSNVATNHQVSHIITLQHVPLIMFMAMGTNL